MDMADALEIVLSLARRLASTPQHIQACDMVEDLAVNEYEDEE